VADGFIAGPLIAQETARPYFAYSPFIRTQRAYNKAYSEVEVMILAAADAGLPLIRLHFDFASDGTFTCPQVPVGNQCDVAIARNYHHPRSHQRGQRRDGRAHKKWLMRALLGRCCPRR
jgi:hypothetical protein